MKTKESELCIGCFERGCNGGCHAKEWRRRYEEFEKKYDESQKMIVYLENFIMRLVHSKCEDTENGD